MEMQADEDAKNRWPFTGPACRVIGRDGETTPPGPATDGTELQGEIGDAAQGTKREEERRREAGQYQARESGRAIARHGSARGVAAGGRPIYRSAECCRAKPGRPGRLVRQPSCRPAHLERRATRHRASDRCASLAAAAFA